MQDRQYSERIKVVGIVPIIAPAEYIRQGKYKEKKFCSLSYGFADVQLFVDYDSYVNGDIEKKKSLIVINTLKSIDAIKGKGKIDYKMFENDMTNKRLISKVYEEHIYLNSKRKKKPSLIKQWAEDMI